MKIEGCFLKMKFVLNASQWWQADHQWTYPLSKALFSALCQSLHLHWITSDKNLAIGVLAQFSSAYSSDIKYLQIPTHMVLSFEKKEQLHKNGCKAIIWWGVQKKSDLLTCHTANQVMELWANVWEDATLQLSSPGHGAFSIAWPGPGRFLTGRWGVTPKFQGKMET